MPNWIPRYGVAHWSATFYDWKGVESDGVIAYHDITNQSGFSTNMIPHNRPCTRATAGRNEETLNCAMVCMGGTPWVDYPPTEEQIDGFAKLWAKICMGEGWTGPRALPDIAAPGCKLFTHAEVAANRDYPLELVMRAQACLTRFPDDSSGSNQDRCARSYGLPTANYGPSEWLDGWPGGTFSKWDLHQLRRSDAPGAGGIELRCRVRQWIVKLQAGITA